MADASDLHEILHFSIRAVIRRLFCEAGSGGWLKETLRAIAKRREYWMCFRPPSTEPAFECPNCGKKVNSIMGNMPANCPFCDIDITQYTGKEVPVAAPVAPAMPSTPGAPVPPGSPATPKA